MSAWEDTIIEEVRNRIREKGIDIRQAFDAFDNDKSGTIDGEEFRRTFRVMDLGLTESEIEKLLRWFDPNDTGQITYRDFCDRLMGSPRPGASQQSGDPNGIMAKLGKILRETQLSIR